MMLVFENGLYRLWVISHNQLVATKHVIFNESVLPAPNDNIGVGHPGNALNSSHEEDK